MPLPPDSPFDIKLTSGRESKAYGLTLDKGSNSLVISAAAQDDSVYVRNVGKRVGDFDEQRNWKLGRGTEKIAIARMGPLGAGRRRAVGLGRRLGAGHPPRGRVGLGSLQAAVRHFATRHFVCLECPSPPGRPSG